MKIKGFSLARGVKEGFSEEVTEQRLEGYVSQQGENEQPPRQ